MQDSEGHHKDNFSEQYFNSFCCWLHIVVEHSLSHQMCCIVLDHL